MAIVLWLICLCISTFVFAYFNLGLLAVSALWGALIAGLIFYYNFNFCIFLIASIFLLLALILNIKFIRRQIITRLIFKKAQKIMPPLSKTEEEAINAGTVSFEGELFSGLPCFKRLLALKQANLSPEEQAFLDGPTEILCTMLDDWQIFKDEDLPVEVWQFIKDQGFMGMIIPKEYGGKGFSAALHSAVILKVGSRNLVAAISLGVPNSLGPAELLLKYGTKEQKDYYLPRLARGEDVPCFALTGPLAGSDAASIPDYGILCFEDFEGTRTLGVRLNWNKRYITLAPIATLIGLAFKLRDPEHLLSNEEERGITCALIPSNLPGIQIGKRHNPLNIMFQNGPIVGTNVFIPLSYIIGGPEKIGQGWRMLMECLSVGRAITLPSSGSASAMVSALATGCYARIRHQFGLYIGGFGGVQELLARIGTNAYVNMAALQFVVARIDEGANPSVLSAIVKYHTTERCRQAINDAMDIHAGKGICLGPKNYMINLYRCVPVNITVEGANVLTRNLIIFGQGAIRCHPFLLKEMQALSANNLASFDELIFSHLGFIARNFSRALFHGMTYAVFASAPAGLNKRHFQHLARYCAAFALMADLISITMGASLKRKENISAMLGDILSYLFLLSACLKRFYDEGQNKADVPFINYLSASLLYDIEERMREIIHNLPNRFIAALLHAACLPLGRTQKKAPNVNTEQVAMLMLAPSESLERLSKGIYKTKRADNFLTLLQETRNKAIKAEELEKRVRIAQKQGLIYGLSEEDLVNAARQKNIIDDKEHSQLLELTKLRAEVIGVDAF